MKHRAIKAVIDSLREAIIDEQHKKCPPYTPPMDDRCQCGYDLLELRKESRCNTIDSYKELRLPGKYLTRRAKRSQ